MKDLYCAFFVCLNFQTADKTKDLFMLFLADQFVCIGYQKFGKAQTSTVEDQVFTTGSPKITK